MYESGTGMWWGNTLTGFSTYLAEDDVRSNTGTYTQGAVPNGWGYCGTSANGTGSVWDFTTSGNGYPCIDQIGRGAGDLLTGSDFPIINSTTGTQSWPHQVLSPIYAWMNTINNNSYKPVHFWTNADTVAVENRDYYTDRPNIDNSATFNGTAGTGFGLLSARPANCTAGPGGNTSGVGYWATDVNGGTLYVCNPTNTWTTFYTPYTYPHPLISNSSVTLPARLRRTSKL